MKIPLAWGLFPPINYLVKFTYMGWMVRINKALGLVHIDFLKEYTMQERIVNIELTDWPSKLKSKRKNKSSGGVFHHWTKCVIIIQTWLLMEPLGNKLGFRSLYSPIGSLLINFVDPATPNTMSTRW